MIEGTERNSGQGESFSVESPRSIEDLLLDVMVYAPLGIAKTVLSNYPALVERGRDSANQQISSARVIGRLTLGQTQAKIDKRIAKVREVVEDIVRPVFEGTSNSQDQVANAPSRFDSKQPNESSIDLDWNPATLPNASTLAIPDYDALSASQVVQRLAGVSRAELEDIVAYEAVTRNRRTVLGKANQLLSAGQE